MTCCSRVVWDRARNKVIAHEEQWSAWIQEYPKARAYTLQGEELYDQFKLLFTDEEVLAGEGNNEMGDNEHPIIISDSDEGEEPNIVLGLPANPPGLREDVIVISDDDDQNADLDAEIEREVDDPFAEIDVDDDPYHLNDVESDDADDINLDLILSDNDSAGDEEDSVDQAPGEIVNAEDKPLDDFKEIEVDSPLVGRGMLKILAATSFSRIPKFSRAPPLWMRKGASSYVAADEDYVDSDSSTSSTSPIKSRRLFK